MAQLDATTRTQRAETLPKRPSACSHHLEAPKSISLHRLLPKKRQEGPRGGLSCSTQTRTAQGCSPGSRSCPGARGSLCSVPKPQLVQGREACEVRNAGGLGRMEQLSLWKPLDIQHFICFQPARAAALGSRTGGSSLT